VVESRWSGGYGLAHERLRDVASAARGAVGAYREGERTDAVGAVAAACFYRVDPRPPTGKGSGRTERQLEGSAQEGRKEGYLELPCVVACAAGVQVFSPARRAQPSRRRWLRARGTTTAARSPYCTARPQRGVTPHRSGSEGRHARSKWRAVAACRSTGSSRGRARGRSRRCSRRRASKLDGTRPSNA
jgi:hypothetical protein